MKNKFNHHQQSFLKIEEWLSGNPIKVVLIALGVEAILIIPFLFRIPSMERNAVLLGFSLRRLMVNGGISIIAILVAVSVLVVLIKDRLYLRALCFLKTRLIHSPAAFVRFQAILLTTSGILLISVMSINYLQVSHTLYTLTVVIEKTFPALLWFSLMPLHLALIAFYAFEGKMSLATLIDGGLYRYLIIIVVILASFFHWLTLLMRISWPYGIGGWFWYFWQKSPPPSYALVIGIPVISSALAFLVLRVRRSTLVFAAAVVLLGTSIQVGYGFAAGDGLESLRQKYVNTPLSEQTRLACSYDGSVLEGVRDYEDDFASSYWYRTKPPGLAAFYLILKDLIISRGSVGIGSNSCFHQITTALTYLLPLASLLVVIPIILLQKILNLENLDGTGALLYVSAANIVLMVLIPDQFLYPFLSVITCLSIVIMVNRKSILAGFTSGLLMFISVFVSFSLLPFIGFAFFYSGLTFLAEGREKVWRKWIVIVLAMVSGFILFWFLSSKFLNYNLIGTYAGAFSDHQEIKSYQFSIMNVLQYALLNNLEFAFWTGFPVYLLSILGSLRSIAAFVKRRFTRMNIFSLAYILMFVVLNFLGQTRGEVGRLWIFLLPAAVIIAANEAMSLLEEPRSGVQLIFSLQIITSSVVFLMMDFK